MYNTAKELLAFHTDEVSLPQAERDEMRERRDANRDRIRSGLERDENPSPTEFVKQGSYAMKTMVQHPELDYDIDDGIYFTKEALTTDNDEEISPQAAKQMVRDAAASDLFNDDPEVLPNCVRILYAAGYHVDVPVYRIVNDGDESISELASDVTWVRSDAKHVTAWFDEENQTQSPDETNGRQLRRVTRFLKKFARSRADWCGNIAGGFTITKLVTEDYVANENREDTTLVDTMRAIRDRLDLSLTVEHPVTPGEMLSKGDGDPKLSFLRDKLSEALDDLAILDQDDCTNSQAMTAWDNVFDTSYFTDKFADPEEDGEEELKALRQAAAAVPSPTKPWLV